MTPGLPSSIWLNVGFATHFVGACASVTVAALLAKHRDRYGPAGNALLAALGLTALWSLAAVVVGEFRLVSQLVLCLRNLSYLMALYRLFSSDGRHASVTPVRPVLLALAMVAVMLPMVALVGAQQRSGTDLGLLLFHTDVMLAMLLAVGSLVLLHNLYVGAAPRARLTLRWPAAALALEWIYELNFSTVAYLSDSWPGQLAALHGLADLGFAAVLALGAVRGRDELKLRPSRAVTFHSFSLLVIGAYFVAMLAVSQWLAYAGGNYARWLQSGFLIVATAAALLVLPSKRARGWLRVTVAKHLFQHRYDYRAEWLRFTQTIGCKSGGSLPLQERAIQALADITDSPAGLLLVPEDGADLVFSARWQWPTAEVPAQAYPQAGAAFLETRDYIVDLEDWRQKPHSPEAESIVPAWLRDDPRAWAIVPLLHYQRLVGVVVLARPPHARKLDWEDFDLLRVVGQQLASYLAEHSVQQALIEAGRFDDFHRRIAFVMHDIKNLASQFSLLARNAERHAENPAFRADMLVTLRNSADKLNALVTRLSRYGGSVEKIEPLPLGRIAREVAGIWQDRHPVTVIERDNCEISGNRESVEQVLTHLVQNGVDASAPDSPVFIAIALDDPWCRIEIVDSGQGMSPEFLRNRLFKPFHSTKSGGFGIGAYEARELVRAMRGRMEVESREGFGTRFVIRLPLSSASAILNPLNPSQKVA